MENALFCRGVEKAQDNARILMREFARRDKVPLQFTLLHLMKVCENWTSSSVWRFPYRNIIFQGIDWCTEVWCSHVVNSKIPIGHSMFWKIWFYKNKNTMISAIIQNYFQIGSWKVARYSVVGAIVRCAYGRRRSTSVARTRCDNDGCARPLAARSCQSRYNGIAHRVRCNCQSTQLLFRIRFFFVHWKNNNETSWVDRRELAEVSLRYLILVAGNKLYLNCACFKQFCFSFSVNG